MVSNELTNKNRPQPPITTEESERLRGQGSHNKSSRNHLTVFMVGNLVSDWIQTIHLPCCLYYHLPKLSAKTRLAHTHTMLYSCKC